MAKKNIVRGDKAMSKKTSTSTDSPLRSMELAGMFLDTSWRVAVPILLLTLLGHWLDTRNHTLPLFSVIGLLLSIVVSSYLIYIQLKMAFPDMFGGKKQ